MVRDRAELLRAMLAEKDQPVSYVDPDARRGYKRKDIKFLGYETREAIDPEICMITAVEVLPGNANEAMHADVLVAQEKSVVCGGATVIGEGLYYNVTTVKQVEAAGEQACLSGLHAERTSDNYSYDGGSDRMLSAQGKPPIGKIQVNNGARTTARYTTVPIARERTSARPRGAKGQGNVEAEDLRLGREKAQGARRRGGAEMVAGEATAVGRIESKFDEQINRHGLRRARYKA